MHWIAYWIALQTAILTNKCFKTSIKTIVEKWSVLESRTIGYLSFRCLCISMKQQIVGSKTFSREKGKLATQKKGIKGGNQFWMYIASMRGAIMHRRQWNSHILQEEWGQVELSSPICWDTSSLQKVKPEWPGNISQKAWNLSVNS